MNLFDKIYKSALISVNEDVYSTANGDYSNKFLSAFSSLPENERDNFLAALTNYNANAKTNLKATMDPTQASTLKGFLDKYHSASEESKDSTSETEEDEAKTDSKTNQTSQASNLTPSNIVV
jgi:hypothetical protein